MLVVSGGRVHAVGIRFRDLPTQAFEVQYTLEEMQPLHRAW